MRKTHAWLWKDSVNKNFIFSLLISLLVLAGGARAGEDFDEFMAKGSLRVAVYKNFAPFSFAKKGKTVGVDVDIARAIAKKLDLDIQIWAIGADENMEDDLRNAVWKGHYLGGGTADFMMHVPFDQEFAEENDKVVFFSPYANEAVVVVRRASSAVEESVMQTFLKGKIGVELDTMPDFYLTSSSRGMFLNNIRHFMTVEEAIAAFVHGEVRSVVAPRSQIEAALGKDRSAFKFSPLEVSGRIRSNWDLAVAVKAGRQELIDAVKTALDELNRSGVVGEIYKKYGVTYTRPVAQLN